MLVNSNFKLKRSLKKAASYEEWAAVAHAFDQNNGLDRWRRKDATRQYDHARTHPDAIYFIYRFRIKWKW